MWRMALVDGGIAFCAARPTFSGEAKSENSRAFA